MGAVIRLAGEAKAAGPGMSSPTPPRLANGDHWFIWVLALAALAVPVIVLLCVDSIPKDTFAWHDVAVSIDRGDFLIPVMALCVETVRRWWREVEAQRSFKAVRILATFACSAAGLVCVIATTTAASVALSVDTGRSITMITGACLVPAVAFGTLAVWLCARD